MDKSALAAQSSPASSPGVLATIVVKLGGSLLELPDLAARLERRLNVLTTPQVVLLVGGGPAAELVRRRDSLDALGDDKAHWLAIRAMTFNSFLVEGLLADSRVVPSLAQCRATWQASRIPILDPYAFLIEHEAAGGVALRRSWSVTSDTIAARVARVARADELLLLKSVSFPASAGDSLGAAELADAAKRSIVDPELPGEVGRCPGLKVRIENLRDSG